LHQGTLDQSRYTFHQDRLKNRLPSPLSLSHFIGSSKILITYEHGVISEMTYTKSHGLEKDGRKSQKQVLPKQGLGTAVLMSRCRSDPPSLAPRTQPSSPKKQKSGLGLRAAKKAVLQRSKTICDALSIPEKKDKAAKTCGVFRFTISMLRAKPSQKVVEKAKAVPTKARTAHYHKTSLTARGSWPGLSQEQISARSNECLYARMLHYPHPGIFRRRFREEGTTSVYGQLPRSANASQFSSSHADSDSRSDTHTIAPSTNTFYTAQEWVEDFDRSTCNGSECGSDCPYRSSECDDDQVSILTLESESWHADDRLWK
ncbi:hypothetical protein GQ43DRAFT_491813, partial [Delitschia confertaspora ATCC 74209]